MNKRKKQKSPVIKDSIHEKVRRKAGEVKAQIDAEFGNSKERQEKIKHFEQQIEQLRKEAEAREEQARKLGAEAKERTDRMVKLEKQVSRLKNGALISFCKICSQMFNVSIEQLQRMSRGDISKLVEMAGRHVQYSRLVRWAMPIVLIPFVAPLLGSISHYARFFMWYLAYKKFKQLVGRDIFPYHLLGKIRKLKTNNFKGEDLELGGE